MSLTSVQGSAANRPLQTPGCLHAQPCAGAVSLLRHVAAELLPGHPRHMVV